MLVSKMSVIVVLDRPWANYTAKHRDLQYRLVIPRLAGPGQGTDFVSHTYSVIPSDRRRQGRRQNAEKQHDPSSNVQGERYCNCVTLET